MPVTEPLEFDPRVSPARVPNSQALNAEAADHLFKSMPSLAFRLKRAIVIRGLRSPGVQQADSCPRSLI